MNRVNTISILLFIITLASFLGCSDKSNIESISVRYIKGNIHPHTSITCGQIKLMLPELVRDTILTENKLLKSIDNQINTLIIESQNDEFKVCDIRVCCKLNYKKGDSISLYIGEFNCIEINMHKAGESDKLAYFIKSHSGYYNYFKENSLKSLKEIQKFGIPRNYKFIVEHRFPLPSDIPR